LEFYWNRSRFHEGIIEHSSNITSFAMGFANNKEEGRSNVCLESIRAYEIEFII
jgi:hypothetical protein